ncbi:MAG: STAS domain-containing protein [Candidatus Eremiobacteraeota bacterium]|nr:STAS domain-containing protein [Candidatus Eremiobacteraeota bacterium]
MNQAATPVVRIHLRGEYDIASAEKLRALLAPAEEAQTAIIDLSEATYIDSATLNSLCRLKVRMVARRGGSVHLVGVKPIHRRLLHITNLDRLFEISE